MHRAIIRRTWQIVWDPIYSISYLLLTNCFVVITALKAGCEQRPAPGQLIGLSDSLFNGTLVNITAAPVETLPDSGDDGFGVTSTGAIVGISIGAALLFLGGLALFWIYRRRQKRLFMGTVESRDNARTGNRSTTPLVGAGAGLSDNEKRAPSQLSDYESRMQHHYTSNAEYYKMLERGIYSSRPQHTVDPSNPRAFPPSVLPAHSAYLPQTHSRQGSQERSTPRPIKKNKPDSYALQTYLSAAEDAGGIGLLPPPPPGRPPVAALGDTLRSHETSSDQYSHTRNSSVDSRGPSPDRRRLINSNMAPTSATPNVPPPPPPPARAAKVPFLAFPSVPRIRVPKKYTPPTISVQGATPTDGPSAHPMSTSENQNITDISIGLDTFDTTAADESGYKKSHWERRIQRPPRLTIETGATDSRKQPWALSEDI